MGRLFLFREVRPGETSPVTWGFERVKDKMTRKNSPFTEHRQSDSLG
jgi:hypothetical protein